VGVVASAALAMGVLTCGLWLPLVCLPQPKFKPAKKKKKKKRGGIFALFSSGKKSRRPPRRALASSRSSRADAMASSRRRSGDDVSDDETVANVEVGNPLNAIDEDGTNTPSVQL